MQISFGLLVTLAKVLKDEEAEIALAAYQELRGLVGGCTIRIWVVAGSYQVGLTQS